MTLGTCRECCGRARARNPKRLYINDQLLGTWGMCGGENAFHLDASRILLHSRLASHPLRPFEVRIRLFFGSVTRLDKEKKIIPYSNIQRQAKWRPFFLWRVQGHACNQLRKTHETCHLAEKSAIEYEPSVGAYILCERERGDAAIRIDAVCLGLNGRNVVL